ncbi:phosphatidylinositol 4-phosphatase [Nematocida sp. AWRm77]|nr:phosphatidylinositol 4-phosphatase [Nematocida sp. AWRm77]
MGHSLENGKMLIREGRGSVVLTYLPEYTEEDGDNEAVISIIKKDTGGGTEELRGGRPFFGVFGEIEVEGAKYLVYVKEAKPVGSVHGRVVYEVLSGESICIGGKEDGRVREMVGGFFRLPGLFLSDGDLASVEAEENTDFVFNFLPLSKFVQRHQGAESFGVRCIQGYFGAVCLSGNLPLVVTILSRRSWRNAGTRYYTRGADLGGHCANTVETLLLTVDERSTPPKEHVFLQSRGSIPLAWEQKINLAYKPPVKMGSAEVSSSLFCKHVAVLRRRYGSFFFLSLLDESGHEEELNASFVSELQKEGADFYAVDYHKLVKDAGSPREFKKQLKDILSRNVMVRTNCVDCLDRTNVVQSQLAKIKLVEQLGLEEYAGEESRSVQDIDDYLPEKEVKKLGQLWNSNANALSMQYTGTSALKNDLTEHGVRTFRGLIQDAISSGKRYVNNNFTDGKMQETIETVTGVRHSVGNFPRGDRRAGMYFVLAMAVMAVAFFQHRLLGVLAFVGVLFAGRVFLIRSLSFPSPLEPTKPHSHKQKGKSHSHKKKSHSHSHGHGHRHKEKEKDKEKDKGSLRDLGRKEAKEAKETKEAKEDRASKNKE